MPNDLPSIGFEPVRHDHLPMLHSWLKKPHVRQWWGEPDQEIRLIREGLETGEVDAFIIRVDSRPIGYIQSWWPTEYEEEAWTRDLSPDTPGIDIFIGESEMIGNGLAAPIVRAFGRRLFENGAPRIVIDPDARNGRAVRAYAKAGFTVYRELEEPDGKTLLMEKFPDPN
ncbi:aminoglycoside 6'-N-acetyltransferase [Mesorhizobium sp. J18]|uniref:GNAT family N-acetyltransferase n=1 Tax=Mesorhizobium sp. J18 TaxID=935263 RepID=UPI00119B43E5|nr:GNAT family N-acetyltransferase [Mesorhizobium sp. J18]TWG88972.1 aminoglycoside 6'-N-acetyltransferase [Mesorhizobium sp. J18]